MSNQSGALHLVLATTGFASFALLWVAVVTGFVLRSSWTQTPTRRGSLDGIHQTATVMGLCLGAVHGLAQLASPDGSITALEVVVPFIDSDDPIGIGVAIIGLDVLVVVALSVIIRHRLGDARWRVLHRLAYAAFMLIVAHVLMSGTDVMPVWVSLVVVSAWLVTVIAWLAATSTLDGATRWLAELMPRRRYIGDLAVRVDARLCTRYGVCEQVAPRVFQLRGEGQLSYRPAVPFAQSDAVRLAIEMCPTRAITLVEKSTDRSYLSGQP